MNWQRYGVVLLAGVCIVVVGCGEGAGNTGKGGMSTAAGIRSRGGEARLPDAPDNGWSYEIRGANSGLCMGLQKEAEGMVLRMASCTGANGQRFQLLAKDGEPGIYSLRSRPDSSHCLAIASGEAVDGSPVGETPCGEGLLATQRWRLKNMGTGYSFVSASSRKCIVVQNASTAAGAALIQYQCNGGSNEVFAMKKFDHGSANPSESGQWSAPIPLGLVPSSAAMLPNGKVLYWSGTGTHSFHGGSTITHTGLYDTVTGDKREREVDTGHEMFCPGEVMTADGRVLVVGGGGTLRLRDVVTSYDFRSDSWRAENSLAIPRWYNAATALGNGGVFTVGGDGDGLQSHSGMEALAELWVPGQVSNSVWKLLDGTSQPSSDIGGNFGLARAQYYRRTALAPSGRLLEFAPSPAMRWHDISGQGKTTIASVREGESNAQGAISAQFASDKVLLTGGSPSFGNEDPKIPESHYPAYTKTFVIDLNTGTAAPAGEMRYPRYQGNGVTLADGTVLAVGGSPISSLFDNTGAILAAELFEPRTGRWTDMAPMASPRMYHSTALLMPDGRVWAGGGGQCNDCSVNHADAEIFSPPYLFKGERPAIAEAPSTLGYGRDVFSAFVKVADSTVERFTLVRMSATTHATNTDQRLVEVPIVSRADGQFKLALPKDRNTAPPGYYMLFAISAKGVPSMAKILRVGDGGGATPAM